MLARRLLVLVLLLAPPALRAQEPAAAPRAVADSFFRFMADERYLDAARLTDLAAFDAYRRQEVEFARSSTQRVTRVSAATLMKHDARMPRAVAEYQSRRINEQMRDVPSRIRHDFGYASADSLAAAPLEEAAARWLATSDPRGRMREAFATRGGPGCPAPAPGELAQLRAAVRLRPAHVIGTVLDDSVAYVVHHPPMVDLDALPDDSVARAAAPAPPLPTAREWQPFSPSMLEVRRLAGGWRVAQSRGLGTMSVYSSTCVPGETTRTRRRR